MASVIERDLRLRVERILRGERHVEDLTAIFLSQRDKLHTQPAVKEVGDFVAHRDVRMKGDSHRQARGVFVTARAFQPVLIDSARTAAELAAAAVGSLGVFTDAEVQAKTGLSRHSAESMLGRCKSKEFGKKRPLNPAEKRLMAMLKEPPTRPIFTPAGLMKDLADVLSRASLLATHEVPALNAAADFVTLFAASKMHGAELALDDDFSAHLKAHGGGDHPIQIWCGCTFWSPFSLVPSTIYVPMFFTELPSAIHCSSALSAMKDWDVPLEINANGVLDLVR